MKKKLIIIIDSIFPSISGGKENWLYEMCRRLDKDFNITIISKKSNKKIFYPIDDLNITHISIPTFSYRRTEITAQLTSQMSFGLISMIYTKYKFGFSKDKIIILSMGSGPIYLPAFIMRKKNFRRVHAARGSLVLWFNDRFPSLSGLWKLIYNSFTLKDADLTIANGYDTYDEMKDYTEKIIVLPNGVDYNKFKFEKRQKSSENIIVSVAGLRPPDNYENLIKKDIKGTAHLIKSIPTIKKNYDGKFKIWLVGGGKKEPYIKLAKEMDVLKNIEFLGEKSNICEILNEATISATLSNPYTGGGGMSMATLESMASGKPIIAWDNHTYNQLVKNNDSGLLVTPGDVQALGEGIARLLNNPEHAKKLGENAQEDAKQYDFNIISKKLAKILDDLFE